MNTSDHVSYWLVCKVCHHMHSADVVASNPEPLMVKSTKYECPLNPGQYADYTLSDCTLEDARKFSR